MPKIEADPEESERILTELKESQEVKGAILSRLEDERQFQIRKIMRERNIHDPELAKKYLVIPSNEEMSLIVRGEIFEQALRRESGIVECNTPVAEELSSLISNPVRYGLTRRIGIQRRPDALYTNIDEKGNTVITGVGEAKMGKLNDRAIDQLESFRDELEKVSTFVDNTSSEELERYGLVEIAKLKKKRENLTQTEIEELKQQNEGELPPVIEISKSFRVTLLLPADRSHKYNGLLHEGVRWSKDNYEKAMKRLLNVKHSQFTIDQIRDITREILENWE